MVRDYRERKPVNKNRPKSKPVGLLVVSFGLVAVSSFGLGVLTDRFLLPPRYPKVDSAQSPGAQENKPQEQPSSPAKDSVTGQQGVSPAPREPSLTFYETLPKGGKIILGSGINPKQSAVQNASPAKTVVETLPKKDQSPPHRTDGGTAQNAETMPASPQDKRATADNVERLNGAGETSKVAAAKKSPVVKGKFSVQVASAKERNEAEAIKSALQEKGFAAYVVESTVSGKGTWYRVRVGKQLDQAAAGNLAKQLGKAVMIIPE